MKTKNQKQTNGAEKLRSIVQWMNNRKESLNENKSILDLIGEYNLFKIKRHENNEIRSHKETTSYLNQRNNS